MTSKTGNRGFTLIEIMVTTVILSLGIIMVYKPFLNLLDVAGYCADYLVIQPVIDEKLWLAEDDLSQRGKLIKVAQQGEFQNANKIFSWNITQDTIGGSNNFNLYRIGITCSWKSGTRLANVQRFAYALQKKQ